jgi:type II secretory ATPase GspE/PulE/Tfp pilus assembly ATPase PilB-like protein
VQRGVFEGFTPSADLRREIARSASRQQISLALAAEKVPSLRSYGEKLVALGEISAELLLAELGD